MADVGPSSYDGFLSYSHAADDLLAPRLQAGLQRFAKPWWKRRALHIFRDEASLSANPHLWTSITDALDDSEWFVLLLSPEAAGSEWVNREIDYWKEHRYPHKILPVVTDGEFGWADGDVAGDAVPASLRGVFGDEPRWVDLRFARSETQLDLRHTRFRDAVADIAAAIRGVAKDELESEEIRQHRRTVRTALTGGAVILALGVAATVGAIVAVDQSNEARAQRDEAERERDRAIVAEQQSEVSAEAEREARLEAENQRLIAEQQAARAEEQAGIAQANAELAESRLLAGAAINVLDRDPELSVLLALEAARGADPAFESVSALHEALQRHRIVRTITWPEAWSMNAGLVGSISPDGRYVAVSGAQHQLAVWDLAAKSDEPIWTFEVPHPDYAVIVPYFNSDGSHVVAAVSWRNFDEPPEQWPAPPPETGVYIWDAQTGALINHSEGPDCPFVTLFQSGRFLDETRPVGAAGPSADDCSNAEGVDIWLLDLATGEKTRGYGESVHTNLWTTPSSLSEDGRFLSYVTTGFETARMGKVVDLISSAQVFETVSPQLAQLSKDGNLLLTGDQRSVSLSDVDSGVERWSVESPANLSTAWFSEDESRVYAGAQDGLIRIWDTETGELLHELKGHRANTSAAAMTADGTRIVSGSGDRTVRVWDLTAQAQGEIAGFDLPGFPVLQSGASEGKHGAILLYEWGSVWNQPGIAYIFDASTGVSEQIFSGYGGGMVRLSPDGDLLAGQPFVAPGMLGPVHIRDVTTGEVHITLEGHCTFDNDRFTQGPDCTAKSGLFGDFLDWVDFSPDGSMLAVSGYSSGTAGVWNVETGEQITALTSLTPSPNVDVVLRFNPTSDLLAVAGPTELTVFETDGWSQVATVPLQYSWNLDFTADGDLLFATDFTKGIVTIDTRTWQYVGEPLVGHEGVVRDIDVSSDGSLLVSGGSDGLIRIWDTGTGEPMQTISLGETTGVTLVHFLDDHHLLVVPQDRPASVMTIDVSELIDIARSRITRGFTDGECATYHIDPCPDLEMIKGG